MRSSLATKVLIGGVLGAIAGGIAYYACGKTAGIDPAARYRFWRLVRSLAATGMTVLVTTHYLDEAAYCDRIAMMDRGRLVALGSLVQLRAAFGQVSAASIESIFVAALARAQSEGLAA